MLIFGGVLLAVIGLPQGLLLTWGGWKLLRYLKGRDVRSARREPSSSRGSGGTELVNWLDVEEGLPGAARLRVASRIIDLGLVMAAADGRIDRRELDAIRYFFRAHGADSDFMGRVDAYLLEPRADPEVACAEIRQLASKDEREVILIALLAVAVADQRLDEREVRVYARIAALLGFSEAEMLRLLRATLGDVGGEPARAEEMSRSQALALLELEGDPEPAEIKAAYRRLAHRHHPDKVAHLGPELVAVAQERMARINRAVEVLRS